MKKLGIGVMLVGLVMLLPLVLRAEEGEIGIVNVTAVFEEYTKMEPVASEFQSERAERTKVWQELQVEAREMQQELDAKRSVLSESERKKMAAAIEAKVGKIKELEREAQTRMNELVQKRVKQIFEVAQEIGQEKGLSLILKEEAVVYVKEAENLSSLVMDRLKGRLDAEKKASRGKKKR